MLLPKCYSTCKTYSYKIYRYIVVSATFLFVYILYFISDFSDHSKKYSVTQQMNISHNFVKL